MLISGVPKTSQGDPGNAEFFRRPRSSCSQSTRLLGPQEISCYSVLRHLLFQGGIRKLKPLVLVVTSEGKFFPTGSGLWRPWDRKRLLRSVNLDDLVSPRWWEELQEDHETGCYYHPHFGDVPVMFLWSLIWNDSRKMLLNTSLYCLWPGDLTLPWAKNWRRLLYQPVEVSSDIKYLTLGWHSLDFTVCSLTPSLLAYSTTQPFLWQTLNQSYLYLLKEQVVVLFSRPACLTLANPMDWNFPGKNTGIGFAFPFSTGSSRPRDRTHVSCIASGFFYHGTIGGAPKEQILRCKVLPSCLPSLRKWQLSWEFIALPIWNLIYCDCKS